MRDRYTPTHPETDPIFIASPAYGIASGDITNWNTAYSWGNHALEGYLTAEADPLSVHYSTYAGGLYTLASDSILLTSGDIGLTFGDINLTNGNITTTNGVLSGATVQSTAGAITSITDFVASGSPGRYLWANDSDTYIGHDTANQIQIICGNTEIVEFASTGLLLPLNGNIAIGDVFTKISSDEAYTWQIYSGQGGNSTELAEFDITSIDFAVQLHCNDGLQVKEPGSILTQPFLANFSVPSLDSDITYTFPAVDATIASVADLAAYQPIDAGLSDIAGLATTNGNIIVGNDAGTGWVAESGDTARISLGVGSTNSPTFTGLTLTGLNVVTPFTPIHSIMFTDETTGVVCGSTTGLYNGTTMCVGLAGGLRAQTLLRLYSGSTAITENTNIFNAYTGTGSTSYGLSCTAQGRGPASGNTIALTCYGGLFLAQAYDRSWANVPNAVTHTAIGGEFQVGDVTGASYTRTGTGQYSFAAARFNVLAAAGTWTANPPVTIYNCLIGAVPTTYGTGAIYWALYATNGNSCFGGNTRFGGVTAPTVALDVTGAGLFSSLVTATYFQTSTAITANSTGTVAIVAKDASLLTNNAGWLPMKKSDGTVIYIPYWL